jgi:4-alpha-glucanotransferase
MKVPRSSGILLHITSLPGRFGIGDLGPSAYEFADFLASAGQKLWQVLPLNPTGYADSPYQCFSAFAGNHLLVSFERLRDAGILEAADLATTQFPDDSVDYGRAIEFKLRVLKRAAQVFLADASRPDRAAFESFCENSASWLDDYALFMACKDVHPENTWATWDLPIRRREPLAIQDWSSTLAPGIQTHKYWQFEFFRQWGKLKAYCQERRIRVMGDVPIYVAHDSSDVWAHPDLFQLNQDGRPTVVSGVPPDYFSATGQLGDTRRRCNCRQRPLDERTGRRVSRSAPECPGRTPDRGRKSRRDYSGGGKATPAIRTPRHEPFAVRVWQ